MPLGIIGKTGLAYHHVWADGYDQELLLEVDPLLRLGQGNVILFKDTFGRSIERGRYLRATEVEYLAFTRNDSVVDLVLEDEQNRSALVLGTWRNLSPLIGLDVLNEGTFNDRMYGLFHVDSWGAEIGTIGANTFSREFLAKIGTRPIKGDYTTDNLTSPITFSLLEAVTLPKSDDRRMKLERLVGKLLRH